MLQLLYDVDVCYEMKRGFTVATLIFLFNIFQAEEILRVTHGVGHPLYKELLQIIHECEISQNIPALEE